MNVARLREFIREVAPEFAGIALRIEQVKSRIGGLYVPAGISETGLPTIIVNVADADENDILAALTHEIAHAATDQALPTQRHDTPEDQDLRREVARRAINGILPIPKVPYERHERDFIRVLVHLWARADVLGYHFMAQSIFPNGNYELSDLFSYLRALGNEPQRMMKLKLREILQIKPPHDFSELWREDVEEIGIEQKENDMNIFETLKRRKESKAASWQELARDIADGKSVKPELAERILADCEKSAEELEALVAKYAERKRKREIVARADGELQKELSQIETRLAACREKLERAQTEYAETSLPLRVRAKAIEEVMSLADSARGQLLNANSHPDSTIRDKYLQTQARMHDLQGRARELQRLVHVNTKTRESFLESLEHDRKHTIQTRHASDPHGVDIDALSAKRKQAEADDCSKAIETQAAELAQVEKQLAQAEREFAQAERELLSC